MSILNQTNFFYQMRETDIVLLERYISTLLEFNKNINLISRKITVKQITQLLNETIQLNNKISYKTIIDAGSGNGLLGVPLAILNKKKQVVLIEKTQKKINFLLEIKKRIPEINLKIIKTSIEDYFLLKGKVRGASIVARGFPNQEILVNLLFRGMVGELILITSEKKIRKMKKGMESIKKKIYNIPMRNNLKIVKMGYVSRETNQKQM